MKLNKLLFVFFVMAYAVTFSQETAEKPKSVNTSQNFRIKDFTEINKKNLSFIYFNQEFAC